MTYFAIALWILAAAFLAYTRRASLRKLANNALALLKYAIHGAPVSEEEAARKLGRPEKLELSEAQAKFVQFLFVNGAQPANLAKDFFKCYPRRGFLFFGTATKDASSLDFDAGNPDQDGAELINSAMYSLGAIIIRAEGDPLATDGPGEYLQTEHPMVKRLAQAGMMR